MSDTTRAQAREPVTVDKPPQAFEAWYWSQYYRLNLEGWDRHGVAQLAWEKQAARITELEAQVAKLLPDAEPPRSTNAIGYTVAQLNARVEHATAAQNKRVAELEASLAIAREGLRRVSVIEIYRGMDADEAIERGIAAVGWAEKTIAELNAARSNHER